MSRWIAGLALVPLLAAGCITGTSRPEDAAADRAADRAADHPPAPDQPRLDVGNACSDGRVRCGPECVDPLTSEDHCGECGNACDAASDRCDNGTCVCGVTGGPCAAGLDCEKGVCKCVSGGLCSGCCADESTCVVDDLDESQCGKDGAPCITCDDLDPCTTDICLAGACATEPSTGAACTASPLVAGTCCNGACCGPGFSCCADGCCLSNLCCASGSVCCAVGTYCCGGVVCCPGGAICCGGQCCPIGQLTCNEGTC